MANTGYKFPTANETDGNGSWLNPDYVHTKDNNWSVNFTNGDSWRWKTFNLNVPSTATINGIEVTIEYRDVFYGETGSRVYCYLSWNGGTSRTDPPKRAPKTGDFPDKATTQILGGPTDLWGRNWSPSDFSNTNFRFIVQDISHVDNDEESGINYVKVNVYYTDIGETAPIVVGISAIIPLFQEVNWNFSLALSSNLSPIGDLFNARDKKLDLTLNRPGSFSFRFPIDDALAAQFEPVRTCVVAYRNGELVWSGPLWTIEDDPVSGWTNVNAIGWFEILNHRILKAQQIYTNQDAGTIAQALLTLANADYATWITAGTTQTSQLRTRTYEIGANIGQEIVNLSEIESGFDFDVDPATKKLNIYTVRMTDYSSILHFGYNSLANNITAFRQSWDASVLANSVYVANQYTNVVQTDLSSRNRYGLFEDRIALTDVPDTAVLSVYAMAELIIRGNPRKTFTFTPRPTNSGVDVPAPFEHYNIGDIVSLSAERGRISLKSQPVRLFGFSIGIDDNGVERVDSVKVALA